MLSIESKKKKEIKIKRRLSEIKRSTEEPSSFRDGEAGGLGLGLFCLAHRVYALGGDYGVRKRKRPLQGGMVMWFTIPYVEYCPIQKETICKHPEDIDIVDIEGLLRAGVDQVSSSRIGSASDTRTEPSEQRTESSRASCPSRMRNKAFDWKETVVAELQPSPEPTVTPKKILIVDDSLPVSRMISMSLSQKGFITKTAPNGLEALSILQYGNRVSELTPTNPEKEYQEIIVINHPFDAIIMDLQMPILNGFETIQRIREIEATAHPGMHQLIVAISAGTTDSDVETAYRNGADCFFRKPFDLQLFIRLLEERSSTTLPVEK